MLVNENVFCQERIGNPAGIVRTADGQLGLGQAATIPKACLPDILLIMAIERIFSTDLMDSLPDDKMEAGIAIADAYIQWKAKIGNSLERDVYLTAIDAYAHAKALAKSKDWTSFGTYEIQGQLGDDLNNIDSQFKHLKGWATNNLDKRLGLEQFETSSTKYAADTYNPFEYRFDPAQLERLQQLVNEIRDELTGLTGIPDNWRNRMLMRLEALQRELHERMSTMDRFWGVVGEALPVLHAAGVAARPIVNRLREIAEIGLRVHATFYGLPMPLGIPLLPPAEDDPEMPTVEIPSKQNLRAPVP